MSTCDTATRSTQIRYGLRRRPNVSCCSCAVKSAARGPWVAIPREFWLVGARRVCGRLIRLPRSRAGGERRDNSAKRPWFVFWQKIVLRRGLPAGERLPQASAEPPLDTQQLKNAKITDPRSRPAPPPRPAPRARGTGPRARRGTTLMGRVRSRAASTDSSGARSPGCS